MDGDSLPLLSANFVPAALGTEPPKFKVYATRWYILTSYCFFAAMQTLIWLTFSPIQQTTIDYFRTSDLFVNTMLATGCFLYPPFQILASWAMERPGGLRKCMKISSVGLIFAGVFRLLALFSPKNPISLWIIFTSAAVNAIIGPAAGGGVSFISATWFPEKERTTATAIMALSSWLGSALGFLLLPIIVNATSINFLFLLTAGLTIVCGVPVLLYWPSGPPTPPSLSMAAEAHEAGKSSTKLFFNRLWQSCKDPTFMTVVLAGGLMSGVWSAWTGLFDEILAPLGYTQIQAGWLGFSATLAATVGGVFFGWVADQFFLRRLKTLFCLLLALSLIPFVEFALCFPSPVLPRPPIQETNFPLLVAICSAGAFFFGAMTPVLYEMAAECIYPMPEGTSVGMLCFMQNVGCASSMYLPQILPASMMNWFFSCSVGVGLLFLLMAPVQYKRSNLRLEQINGAASGNGNGHKGI
jgi:MFS family permease